MIISKNVKIRQLRKGDFNTVLFCLFTLFFSCLLNSAETPELTIVKNAQSDYVIVTPDSPNSHVKYASNVLKSVLKSCTGAELAVCEESRIPSGKNKIYLGNTLAAQKAGVKVNEINDWTYIKQVSGKDLYLAGCDNTAPRTMKYPDTMGLYGSLKAVTSFLQDEIGVVFLAPGKRGEMPTEINTYFPKKDVLNINSSLNVKRSPVFKYCTQNWWRDQPYSFANNYIADTRLSLQGGHSYYGAVPKEKYGKTNPEYFAEINGRRDSSQNHLCISNPEVQELMLKELDKRLDQGFDAVELGQTDGYQPCQCKNCQALHPDFKERLWIVHSGIAKEMEKRRPGKKIIIIAYGPTVEPPKTFKKFSDNVIIELAISNDAEEQIKTWEKITDKIVVYLYNWGYYQIAGFGPKRNPDFASRQLRLFRDSKIMGMYLCGWGENMGLEGPVYYVYGQLAGNPDLDPQKLADDYYKASFQESYPYMKDFFNALYRQLDIYTCLDNDLRKYYTLSCEGKGPFYFRNAIDVISYTFPPQLINEMEKKLNQARAESRNQGVKARIKNITREFNYLKNLSFICNAYKAYLFNPRPELLMPLLDAIEARNAMIDSYYDKDGKMIVPEGYFEFFGNAPKQELMQNNCMIPVTTPLNWNVKSMRDKSSVPKVEIKPYSVRKISAPVKMDGKLEESFNKDLSKEKLVEINMNKLNAQTNFATLYDDKNIYLVFDCELPENSKIDERAKGSDGNCWENECIEIFIDPFGSQQKFYHVIFNPAANSFFDSRLGFIQDPLNPDFSKEDVSWNGKWEYSAFLDRQNKKWTAAVKIPFKTLGVECPSKGATWTLNIGREHYFSKTAVNPGEKFNLELSVWSIPNSGAFAEMDAFKPIIFE